MSRKKRPKRFFCNVSNKAPAILMEFDNPFPVYINSVVACVQ